MRRPRRELSEGTRRLVEELYRTGSIRAYSAPSGNRLQLIRQIGESGEPEAIPELLPLAVTGRAKEAEAVAQAIGKLVRILRPKEFVDFDQNVRQGYSNWKERREAWYSLKPRDVKYLASLGDDAVSLLGIASCHMNGYVREAAVKELGRIRTGGELPFLLLRVNDWVPFVRMTTLQLLQERIEAKYATHFVQWLPLAARLRAARRWNLEELVEAIEKLLETPGATECLRKGLESDDREVRRLSYGYLLRPEAEEALEIIQKALVDADPVNRLRGVRALAKRPVDERRLEIVRAAIRDSSPRVRLEALRVYAGADPPDAMELLEKHLLDTNISVREEAQFFSEKNGRKDLQNFYLAKTQAARGEQLCAAIAGVGEKGTASDAKEIEKFLAEGSSRVRAATVRALARLDGGKYVEQFMVSLTDASRRVAREGIAALAKRANSAGGARLWNVFERCKSAREKRGVLFLIARLSRWESLVGLLRAKGDPDEEVSLAADKCLQRLWTRWNRSFVGPSKEQAERLKALLNTHALLLSEEKRCWLQKLLDEVA